MNSNYFYKNIKILSLFAFLFLLPFDVFSATLSLSPSTSSTNVGDVFQVNVILDTQGDDVHGVDINALNFNPSLLEVQDDSPGTPGTQISPGTIMLQNVYNSTANGRIVFSQIPITGQTYAGQGILAIIRFKALAQGTANVNFDFTLGNTLDSNVASNGHDSLSGVVNGVYTITNSQGPTPTPSPSGGGGGGGGGGYYPTPTPTQSSPSVPSAPSTYGLKEGDMISAVGTSDPDIYIVNEFGYKRLFLNPTIFNFYGHLGGWKNVKSASSSTRDAFITSGLFKNCETNDGKIYGIEIIGEDTGVLHHINISGAQATSADPNFFKKVFCINNREFNWYSKSTPYTSLSSIPVYSRTASPSSSSQSVGTKRLALIKTSDNSIIYYINSNGIKKPVPLGEVFSSYGNKMENVQIVSSQELQLYQDYQGVIYNNKVYIIENGSKRWVSTNVAFNNLNLNWDRIVPVNLIEFNYYPSGLDIN